MTHKHHIMPKHMTGGIYDNSPDNITPLISVELHAALHKDLWRHLGKKEDLMAYKMLLSESLSGIMQSPEMEKKRRESLKKSMLGNANGSGNKGRHNTPEQNLKISEKTKEAMAKPEIREKYLKAKNTPEAIQKQIRNVRKAKKRPEVIANHWKATHTPEFIEKSRQSVSEKFHTPEVIDKKNKTLKSPEYRKKQSKIMKQIWADKKVKI